MEKVIAGIQQIGIGNPNAPEATEWYREYFGMDIKVFEDEATAELMAPYTGGKPQDRNAILTMSMRGGGGFEIWQFTSRTPVAADFEIQLGDLGINACKIKSIDVAKTYEDFNMAGLEVLTSLKENPAGDLSFFVKDLNGNLFQVVKGLEFFSKRADRTTGGVAGAIIGSSDIEKSRTLYSDILGYDEVVYDETDSFADFDGIFGGEKKIRRVLLRHSQPREGGFSKLLGPTEIELVQIMDKRVKPKKIFEDRYWGDLGFIHLCFDVQGMDALKEECKSKGFPFTVDSADSFGMGTAAGRFSYVEDPDGTLIEFVETHKVPIMQKLGLSIDMTKRDPRKSLPNFILSAMRINKMKPSK
ncbi:MAG: VOC family protein [Balneolaceae bacterium]